MNKLRRGIVVLLLIFAFGLSYAETKKMGKQILLEKREENLRKQQVLVLPEIQTQPGVPVEVVADTSTAKEEEPEAKKEKKDYRIEIIKNKRGQEQDVRFIAPNGEIIKTISFLDIIVSKKGNYAIHRSKDELKIGKYDRKERILLDAKGNERWRKEWTMPYQDPEDGFTGWFEGISDNGERIYITYPEIKDKSKPVWVEGNGIYWMEVYDTVGKLLVKTNQDHLLSHIEISPDGKIVGAKTGVVIDDKYVEYLFFLDIDTGRTKIIKATGHGWNISYVLSSSPKPPLSGKIRLYWRVYQDNSILKSRGQKKLSFDELSEDISGLFLNEK